MVFASHHPLSWPDSFCFVAARKAISVILLPSPLPSLGWHCSPNPLQSPAFTLPMAAMAAAGRIAGAGGCIQGFGGCFFHAEALLQIPLGCTWGWRCPCCFGGMGAVLHRCRMALHGCCMGLRPAQPPEPGLGCSQDRCGCFWGYSRLLTFCQWFFSPANCNRQCMSALTLKSNSRAVKPISRTEARLAVSGAGPAGVACPS